MKTFWNTASAVAGTLLLSLSASAETIYTMTNDPVENGNVVLAYDLADDGRLTLKGTHPTGGKGWRTQIALPHFGPFDIDQPLIVDRDAARLYAVNGGSDTIAVFDISKDGALTPVPGSPFPSGGVNPASVGLADETLIVVNKNEDPDRDMTASLPNYASFQIAESGALAPVASDRVALDHIARSPTQALVARNRFLFDGDFGSFWVPAREAMWGPSMHDQAPSQLRSLLIGKDGSLTLADELEAPAAAFEGGIDTNEDGKVDPLMFGLQVHPTEPILYVSFVTAAKLGVYEWDEAGKLSFLGTAPNSGGLICWVLVNKAGTRAYTTNNASDSVSVYDLSDPRKPVELQHLVLEGLGAPYQLGFSPDEGHIIVSKHRTFDATPVGEGSLLNVLAVAEDGTVTEVASSPLTVPSRGDLFARPMGIASY